MWEFIFLNFFVFFFLLLSISEQKYLSRVSFTQSDTKITSFSPLYLLIFILVVFTATFVFLFTAEESVVQWYIRGAFSFLIIFHARLITLGRRMLISMLVVSVAVLLSYLRFTLFENFFIHNVFLLLSIVWIGPFLIKLGILTQKRFIFISIVWFLYDIWYVWLSSSAVHVLDLGHAIGFPMAIMWGESLIGSGDLLWANLFVSVLATNKWKFVAAFVVVLSNILFGVYSYSTGTYLLFPLLVLWIPIGFGILYVKKTYPNLLPIIKV